jgi:prepilin signal peptidase PulO-like enzyme (type II secretory pathway)
MATFLSIYLFLFGLLIGSFLNVLIYRLPLKKDFIYLRSACTQCGIQLRWYHNIPLLSFLFLRGKCSFCGTRISWRYPLIELLTGLVAFWLSPESLSFESIGLWFFYFAIACAFICHFFIDLDHHLLLDSLNLYLLLLILPFTVLTQHWTYWVIGGALGFGAPLAVTWIFYKLRGQIGLGGGDIKLFGVLGLLLGPIGVMLTIFLSCMVGAVIGITLIVAKKLTKDRPMPFGPAILLVAALQIFFPQQFALIQSWFFPMP